MYPAGGFPAAGSFRSDHFSVFIHLSYEPDAEEEQIPEPPALEDRREAWAKVGTVR